MPPPPPPPGPPPPPAPPPPGPPVLTKSEQNSRGALLSQINNGQPKLKSTKHLMNDRSGPSVDGKKSDSSSTSGNAKADGDTARGGTAPKTVGASSGRSMQSELQAMLAKRSGGGGGSPTPLSPAQTAATQPVRKLSLTPGQNQDNNAAPTVNGSAEKPAQRPTPPNGKPRPPPPVRTDITRTASPAPDITRKVSPAPPSPTLPEPPADAWQAASLSTDGSNSPRGGQKPLPAIPSSEPKRALPALPVPKTDTTPSSPRTPSRPPPPPRAPPQRDPSPPLPPPPSGTSAPTRQSPAGSTGYMANQPPPAPPPRVSSDKEVNDGRPPRPPALRTNTAVTKDFDSAFIFKPLQELPAPMQYYGTQKIYPSRKSGDAATRNAHKAPPPPPPPPVR